jgi:hypothetical protein
MSISVGQIVAEAIERYSGIRGMSSATIAMRLDKVQQLLYQFVGEVTTKDMAITADEVKVVDTNYRCDNLIKAYYYDRTGLVAGTEAPAGTEYSEVIDIELLKEYDHPSYVRLPMYTDAKYSVLTLFYRAIPTPISSDDSTWDTTYLCVDDEYSDLVLYKLIKTIATFGDIPDISISNNYEREYESLLAKAKSDFYRRKMRNNPDKITFREIW